jgi:hypothetical protein
MKVAFKNDKFRRTRGGYSRLLNITCEKCGAEICRYQKDGPGALRRMYIDRILDCKVSIDKKELVCPKQHLLGIKIVYEKENRPGFRLFVDAVKKPIVKS